MITATALATQLLLIVFPGLVLHRALAMRLLAADTNQTSITIGEIELLGYGLLPGLAIANTIGTVLALFGLFQTWLFVAVMLVAVLWRWRDTAATLSAIGQLFQLGWRSLVHGNLMLIVAVGVFVMTAFGMLMEAQQPSGNVDVWNHNFPLAQSIVSHHGFVVPQIDNMFYGTYPIFFHMFFAEGLLFVDHIMAAKAANTIIYLSFLISLISFSQHARSLAALILFLMIINSSFFSGGASDAMTDIPRICFTVLALAFTCQYLRHRRLYFVFAAGLLAGGAVAGKYSELPTPFLIGLAFLPGLIRLKKQEWIATAIFAAAFLPVAAYPYLRNLIYFSNPVYPFVFGHPGISDEYMIDLRKAVFFDIADPAFRSFSQDLLTWQGWVDFFRAVQEMFFSRWNYPDLTLWLIAVGALFRRSHIAYLALCTFIMLALWYTVGGINFRWGMGSGLMLLTTSFLSAVWLIDQIVARLEPSGNDWLALSRLGLDRSWAEAVPAWLSPNNAFRAALAGLAIYCLATTGEKYFREGGLVALLPSWNDKEQAQALLRGSRDFDAYLARTREGFEIYRYIGDHDLKMVWQPFDNGAWFYQSAYNGRTGNWIVPYYLMPKSPAELGRFLRDYDIKYFVFRDGLAGYTAERLGYKHIELSYELMRPLIAKSRRLLVDPFGWELYEINSAPMQ